MLIHNFVFKIQIVKNGFKGPKRFWTFEKRDPGPDCCKTRELLATRQTIFIKLSTETGICRRPLMHSPHIVHPQERNAQ